jgi:O-antigen/teichoic acid export membrane protein
MSFLKTLYHKYKNSPILKRIANGAFWSLTGVAMAKFLVLVAGIICARILGTAQFGELGIVRSTIGMFIVIGASGLGYTANKYIAEYRAVGNTQKIVQIYNLTIVFGVLVGIVITLAVLLSSRYLADSVLDNPGLEVSIRLGAILLFMSIFNSVQNGVLSGFEEFKTIAINTFISSVVEALGIIVGAYAYGTEGAIVGYGVSFIVWAIINYFSIKKVFSSENIPMRYSWLSREDIFIIWNFSIPAAMNTIMVVPAFWIIKTLLVNFCGYESLGIYEAADQWKVIILFVPGAIANILLPIFSNIQGAKNETSFAKTLNYSMLINGGVALILFVMVFFCQHLIINFYGSGFEDSSTLVVLCLSTVFSSIAQVMTLSLISKGMVWISFVFNFIWALILIGSTYVMLINNVGVIALAWANVIAYCIHCVLQFGYIKNVIR